MATIQITDETLDAEIKKNKMYTNDLNFFGKINDSTNNKSSAFKSTSSKLGKQK